MNVHRRSVRQTFRSLTSHLVLEGNEIIPVLLPADCVFKLPMRDLVRAKGAIATLKSLVS